MTCTFVKLGRLGARRILLKLRSNELSRSARSQMVGSRKHASDCPIPSALRPSFLALGGYRTCPVLPVPSDPQIPTRVEGKTAHSVEGIVVSGKIRIVPGAEEGEKYSSVGDAVVEDPDYISYTIHIGVVNTQGSPLNRLGSL